MTLVRVLNGNTPEFGEGCWLAETAVVIGDVVMGSQCTVWYNAVVRGDVHSIRIGDKVNIQDGVVIHCEYQTSPTTIGSNITIGHNAIVHGCEIQDHVLIGMGAIVMNNAVVKSGSVIGAGAVVREGQVIESGSIYAGVPAKKVKDVDPDKVRAMVQDSADRYVKYAGWYQSDT